jgi:hypothetical protein
VPKAFPLFALFITACAIGTTEFMVSGLLPQLHPPGPRRCRRGRQLELDRQACGRAGVMPNSCDRGVLR